MRRQNSKESGSELLVQYTSKPVSGWGGIVSFTRFCDRIGLRSVLAAALPDGRTSPNQIRVVDQVVQLMLTVLTGGSRFDHVERVRADEVVRQIAGAKRFGSARSITRYLGNFVQGQSEDLQRSLNSFLFGLLQDANDVLDLDSTVFTRYGDQEGSTKGYNPQRHGARSHHPLLAMFANMKIIAHAWLRAGSASPHRGCQEFLLELLAQLPDRFRIIAVRADSGFYSRDFLALLEECKLPYAIRVKMSQGMKRWCSGLTDWTSVSSDIDITEGFYESPKNKGVLRRFIVVREALRRESRGTLFEIVDYEYHSIVTTMTDTAVDVWRFYNKRGDCENRIKELKYDFNADGFCLARFAGTEAAFRVICFTYNLVSLFRSTVLHDTKTTLGTIRNRLFVIGASVGSSGRKTILRLGLTGRWKAEFSKLLRSIDSWADSTAPQLAKALNLSGLETPTPWRIRHVGMFLGMLN